ncbi:MAG: type III-A CRISPR-associated protein Cas10/Csm1 [Syntrophomonadaceae bacterium]|nr:type III-A CRISPR-associated protein Cas10/Csm1 [Syntrophomonadaceae bacterium]
MYDRLYKLTVGALLHDIGKIVYRASQIDSRAHPVSGQALLSQYIDDPQINEILLYHHGKDLKNAALNPDSLAYIVYYADNVAAATDRREAEDENTYGFDPGLPQASVFNLLNNNTSNYKYKAVAAENINFPCEIDRIDAAVYNRIVQDLKMRLNAVKWEPEYINSLLELNEAHLSYVPSSTLLSEVADISLYDHHRLTAAVAACIYIYLLNQDRTNFKAELLDGEQAFRNKKAFMMFSCDISGIQQFIYTIASKRALKALRSRSFYLEILLEHIVDTLLKAVSLSRANLIYTGGGHAYMLLPNTEQVKETLQNILNNINKWFITKMGTSLFIAYAFETCSSNDLMNIPYQQSPYRSIFQRLSRKISEHKMKRYDADNIRLLNSTLVENTGRECSNCGAASMLLDQEDICHICNSLIDLSREIIRPDSLIVTTSQRISNRSSMILPAGDGKDCYLYVMSEEDLKKVIEKEGQDILAIYAKNKMYTGYKYSTKLWMGDYYYTTDGDMSSFEELAQQSKGIERLAVLRADVDNLGAAFVSGFIREKEKDEYERNRYLTLSRTASLSRQLSMFFKYHINNLLRGQIQEIQRFRLSGDDARSAKKAVIVYSGGDDMFIVGAWDQVIELAVDLRRAFKQYTADALSFSAGIGMYPSKYPVSRMAEEVGQLEKEAKNTDGKNALALFGVELLPDDRGEYQRVVRHLYKWDDFTESVTGQKLRVLQEYFSQNTLDEEGGGNSFLYKLMNCIVQAENDRINIARYAYLLSRMAPAGQDVSDEQRTRYREFASKMYEWILDHKDRKELLTAINLFIYLTRKKEEDE